MDYNLSKGKIIFWDTLNKELNNFTTIEQDRLKQIAYSFENLVAIMPDENNGIYSAKRLANAILNVGPVEFKSEIDRITSLVLEEYGKTSATTVINKNHFVPEQHQELNGKFGKFVQAQSDEFENELRSYIEEEIDLLNDLNNSELSVEGLRKKLIVPSNFDNDKDSLPNLKETDKKLGTITFNSNGEIEKISCAYCSKSDVYFIAHDKFGCFSCNSEFLVPMEIGDNLK